jgi:hypothetical protein
MKEMFYHSDGTMSVGSEYMFLEQPETPVIMSVIAVAVGGVFLGLRFKALILIAATAFLIVGSVAWNRLGLPGQVSMADCVILAFALAFAYLIGISLSVYLDRNEG